MADLVYMAKSKWTALLDSIRSKGGTSAPMTADEAIAAVDAIETGASGLTLPQEYQQVEYVGNNNTAYITANLAKIYPASGTLTITAEMSMEHGSATGIVFGFSDYKGNWLGVLSNGTVSLGAGMSFSAAVDCKVKNSYELVFETSRTYAQCGGETISRDVDDARNANFCIFNAPNGNYPAIAKIYTMTVCIDYGNRKMILRDYIPCYRISDGVIGFYDLITGTFLQQSNSAGSLSKGPDVLTPTQLLNIILGGDGA